MAKSTIEKFIKNYLRNKRISEGDKGYEAWLRKNGVDPTLKLSDSTADAYGEEALLSSDHSSVKETLADRGLLKSGYAKYLDASIKGAREEKVNKAIDSYLSSDAKNRSAYSEERARLEEIRIAEEKKAEEERLKAEQKAKEEAEKAEQKAKEEAIKAAEKLKEEAAKKEEEREKAIQKKNDAIYKEAKRALESSQIIDYDKAYAKALEFGLDEDSASSLAKTTTETARSAAINKVTTAIISRALTMNQTREYALSLGLSKEDADSLAELAFKTNESVGDIVSQGNYLDYLREQINKNN